MTASFESVELTRAVMPGGYALEKRGWEYRFFKVPEDRYASLASVRLSLNVRSGNALVLLNGYLDNPVIPVQGSGAELTFPIEDCEAGENVLAFKGHVDITDAAFVPGSGVSGSRVTAGRTDDPLLKAVEFLFNSQIKVPQKSPFRGACYCIYDYDDQCHRMPNWVWNNAVIVSALIGLIKSGRYTGREGALQKFAVEIGEEYLRTQVRDRASPVYGALVSRYKNLGAPDHPADCLVGPNDTSFSVKWALLPLYELTGDERYLEAADLALSFVRDCARMRDFVPLDYNLNTGAWGDYTIIDTAFLPEGLEARDRLDGKKRYAGDIAFFMDRFIRQFSLDSGFYGQNYTPAKGVTGTLFSRGEGWAIEGLLAAYRSTADTRYLKEAARIALLMAAEQNADGSWAYVLGFKGVPDNADKAGTGICEKGTPILAYLFIELYEIDSSLVVLREAAERALAWCEANMSEDDGLGYGGIKARSLNSGIIGLPFLTTATGYANAFYILAKIKSFSRRKP